MRNTALALATILAVMLLAAVPADAAVRNINLAPTGAQGVGGTATVITGMVGGAAPYQNVEVNVRMNQLPPAGGLYQAWLINSDTGQVMSLGVFSGTSFTGRTSLAQAQGIDMFDNVAVSYLAPGAASVTPGIGTQPAVSPNIVALGALPGTAVTAADFGRIAVLPEDEMFQRQMTTERFRLTQAEVMDLRMRGFDYAQIGAIANAAQRCGRPVSEVARALEQGQTWNQIAQACNVTVAQLLTPVPLVGVAGVQEEFVPGTTLVIPNHYLRRPNGAVVVTRDQWLRYRTAGYSWQEVAIAANISLQTGERVGDILRMTRVQGLTFRQIAMDRGLVWSDVQDVSLWPWERGGGAETIVIVTPQPTMRTTPTNPPMNY